MVSSADFFPGGLIGARPSCYRLAEAVGLKRLANPKQVANLTPFQQLPPFRTIGVTNTLPSFM
ncbi:MAG: hypothetical protein N3E46_09320 [Gemmataceae bacterium]|nr:hypothetical protein [Gemmataceae bacterium]